jgi:hypothetical protein
VGKRPPFAALIRRGEIGNFVAGFEHLNSSYV